VMLYFAISRFRVSRVGFDVKPYELARAKSLKRADGRPPSPLSQCHLIGDFLCPPPAAFAPATCHLLSDMWLGVGPPGSVLRSLKPTKVQRRG
jgi:hypothetical protein